MQIKELLNSLNFEQSQSGLKYILKVFSLINFKIEKTTKNLENLDRPIHVIVLAVMNVLSEIIELK